MSATTGDVAAGPASGRKSGRVIDRLDRLALPHLQSGCQLSVARAEWRMTHVLHGVHQHDFLVFSALARTHRAVWAGRARAGAPFPLTHSGRRPSHWNEPQRCALANICTIV